MTADGWTRRAVMASLLGGLGTAGLAMPLREADGFGLRFGNDERIFPVHIAPAGPVTDDDLEKISAFVEAVSADKADYSDRHLDPGLAPMIATVGLAATRALGRPALLEVLCRVPGDTEDEISDRLHADGGAVDLRLSGLARATLRQTTEDLESGGAGVYLMSSVVHLDTGSSRRWSRILR